MSYMNGEAAAGVQSDIPVEYRQGVELIRKLHNRYSSPSEHLGTGDINMQTVIKDTFSASKIQRLQMEAVLSKRYPGIDGFTFDSSIKTVGDVINYIENAGKRNQQKL